MSRAAEEPREVMVERAEPSPRGGFFARHGRKLWWLHSLYALGLGIFVVLFARKGFAHSRWLVASLGGAWLLLLVTFRLFGSGKERVIAGRGAKVRYFVVTYALKNLYQGMLFFLLPFYWQSASLDAPNRWFIVVLGLCAIASTLDVIFDQVIMRWRSLASVLYAVTLFGCLNLTIPALLPQNRSLHVLIAAAGIAAFALWSFHVSMRVFQQPLAALLAILILVGLVAGSSAAVYEFRHVVPPVPMHVTAAGVGPRQLDDGRLALEVKTIHASLLGDLIAVTEVVVPGGEGDRLRHVWRRRGQWVLRRGDTERIPGGPKGTVRLKSRLAADELPIEPAGQWTVDVETEDGQLVGRARFTVIDQ
jgi:hypothetical protein